MSRQNQERLDQGNGEHQEHDQRYRVQELPGNAIREGERREGDHCREHAHRYRPRDRAGARYRRPGTLQAVFPLRRDAFAHNHRVVHDDSHRQQQSEKRDQVQVQSEGREKQQRAQHRGGDANGHPDGHPEIEDHGKEQEHQRESEKPGADHRPELRVGEQRAVVPHEYAGARGRLIALDQCPGLGGELGHVVNFRGADVQEHRRDAVHFPVHIDIGEAVDDRRHVSQPYDRAVDVCNQGDIQEILAHHALLFSAQDQPARVRTQFSGRQVERGLAYRLRQPGNRQVVAPQLLLADDNGDFAVRRAENGNHRE